MTHARFFRKRVARFRPLQDFSLLDQAATSRLGPQDWKASEIKSARSLGCIHFRAARLTNSVSPLAGTRRAREFRLTIRRPARWGSRTLPRPIPRLPHRPRFSVHRLPSVLHRATFEWSDNFTWTRGKHEIKFGADFTRVRNNFYYDYYNNGSEDFTFGDFTGDEYADFVAGFSDEYFQSSPATYGIRTGSAAVYAQDTWKILPRLTLNYGFCFAMFLSRP